MHNLGQCTPCAWFHKVTGCHTGTACTFCHRCPKAASKQRRKQSLIQKKKEEASASSARPVPPKSGAPGWPPNSNLANLATYGVFIKQKTCCDINGHPKQYILVGTIFNYRFHFGLLGTCIYLSPQHTHVWRRENMRIVWTFLKTFSWKSKMKPVVKYGVHLDILLRVPIYVREMHIFNERHVNHKIC